MTVNIYEHSVSLSKDRAGEVWCAVLSSWRLSTDCLFPSQCLQNLVATKCRASLVAQMVKNPSAMWETWGSIPELGRSPGGGHGTPLQYSCLENPMDRGAWQAAVHGVTELDTTEWLSTAQVQGSIWVGYFAPGKWRVWNNKRLWVHHLSDSYKIRK